MIEIEVQNNKCRMFGPIKERQKIYKAFKVRNPNAFHIRPYMPKGWDGCFDYVSDTGMFQTGLLPKILEKAKDFDIKMKLNDQRDLNLKPKLRTKLKAPYVLRDYQAAAVQAVIDNKVKKISFPRGGLKEATNAGKTIICAGLYEAYRKPTIFVMNSAELFRDALRDLPKMMKSGKMGYIGNGKVIMGDVMICMVMSLKNRLKEPQVKKWLSTVKVALFDEGDMADNKTNKTVITNLYSTPVRVALSGTLQAVTKKDGNILKKDLPHYLNIEGFFGPLIHETTNRQMIDMGLSSEVQVKFVRGNELNLGKTYAEQVDECIIKNKTRNKKIIKRIKYHADKGRTNQLIILQRHEHIKKVFKLLQKANLGLNIDWVHHSRRDRFRVVDEFKAGKIDILIGSMILKRGKNFPLMKYMLNAGAGKSPENIIQLLGRAFRGCKFYEDMWDEGTYLKRHSRKRDLYYRNEKLEVINKYK